MMLSAGLLLQTKVTDIDEIHAFATENNCGDVSYENNLAKILPFCHTTFMACKSPESMQRYLAKLNIQKLREDLRAVEPLVTLVFDDGAVACSVAGISSLLTLNTVLSRYWQVSKLSNCRVKHNGVRLFLSVAGKKRLADLGINDNDLFEIEDIRVTKPCDDGCVDIANTSTNLNGPRTSSASGRSSSRRKKKVKKGKGKR